MATREASTGALDVALERVMHAVDELGVVHGESLASFR